MECTKGSSSGRGLSIPEMVFHLKSCFIKFSLHHQILYYYFYIFLLNSLVQVELLGVSMDWFESSLCPTRTRPDQIGWRKIRSTTNWQQREETCAIQRECLMPFLIELHRKILILCLLILWSLRECLVVWNHSEVHCRRNLQESAFKCSRDYNSFGENQYQRISKILDLLW